MIFFLLVVGLAEDSHAGDIAVIALIASAEVGDHTVAFVIAPIVVTC